MSIIDLSDTHEDRQYKQYLYARENYDMFAKFLKSENNARFQAEFMNYMTDDWGLRVIYPELPILMFESMKKLSFKEFDELSEDERKMIINFFVCEHACRFIEESSEENAQNIRAFHARLKMMPTL